MDKETLGHVFEPFFTTKEMGKGTGLGLSTVYGIVTQNNGFINVYSEPGEGTAFRIYFPRHLGVAEKESRETEAQIPRGHGETILVVEDDTGVLALVQKILEELGYTVLASENPREAERMARDYEGDIHLLVTDVVMPEMNGKELARKIQEIRSGTRVLFMSGYTTDVIAHHGVLDAGVHFIQKPISKKGLSVKVREALFNKELP